MKKKFFIVLFFVLFMLIVFISGCSSPKYSFVYHTNSESVFDTVTLKKKELKTFVQPIPEKEGYTFDGWYFDSELENAFDFKKITEGVNELYAKYYINEYTIRVYHEDNIDKEYKFCYNDAIILDELSKDEYTFKGYYMDPELTQEFSLTNMPANNIELYPAFYYGKPFSYNISVTSNSLQGLSFSGGALNQIITEERNFEPIEIQENYGYKYLYYELDGEKYSDPVIDVKGIDSDKEIVVFCEYSTYELPIINIDTNNVPIDSKTDYVNMHFSIGNCEGALESVDGGIRLRGNSTAYYPKHPYRIKFDKKQSLFGLEKAKSWVLLADYLDPSCLHNYVALSLGNKLDGLSFTPTPHKVNLYLNGEYQGLYTLCEQIQENKGRIDIEKKITADMVDLKDFNFLISMDYSVVNDPDAILNETYFYLEDYDKYIELKYPEKSDFVSEEQFNSFFEQLKQYVKEVFDSFENNQFDYIKENCNVDSLIDYMIVDAIMGEQDHFSKSFNMYFTTTSSNNNENNKLNFGPIWDYDWCLYTQWTGQPNMEYEITDDILFSNVFFHIFDINLEAMTLLKERYSVFSDDFNSAIVDILLYEYSIEESLKLNALKWYGEYDIDIMEKNVMFLNKFLLYRKKLLDNCWKL